MSDETKDHAPPKLRLSRDLKASFESADSGDAEDTPPPEKETIPAPANQSQAPEIETKKGKASFDPKNPFGDQIKSSEIKTPIASPISPSPGLANPRAPQAVDSSGTRVEEAVNSMQNESRSVTQKNSMIPSVIVIVLLLCLLLGSGFGLWVILRSGSNPDSSGQVVKEPATKKVTPSSSIERAKATIAKVPVLDVEAMTGGKTEPVEPVRLEKPTVTAELAEPTISDNPDSMTTEIAEPAVEPDGEIAPPPSLSNTSDIRSAEPEPVGPSNSEIKASKESVSRYLSNIQISGIRKGEQPAIMIEGERFVVGDIVDSGTKLKFDGLRDGRLAFRDSYEIIYLKSF
jgi:hypothetical protein